MVGDGADICFVKGITNEGYYLLPMKYDLLQTLLPYLEAYERAYPKAQHPQHFAVWLVRQTTESEQVAARNSDHPPHENLVGVLIFTTNPSVSRHREVRPDFGQTAVTEHQPVANEARFFVELDQQVTP